MLGSAAGGGVPQWNCACPNCQAARRNAGVKSRSQDSMAVSADGRRWFLLNVSPDVARQIEAHEALQPIPDGKSALRTSPVVGAVLTNGDLDHCIGLLSLREWTPLCLYATLETYAGLVEQNAMFRTLNRTRQHLIFRQVKLDVFSPLLDAEGTPSGLSVCAFPVAGKVPLHMESWLEPSSETNVGLIVEEEATGARLAYVPGAGSVEGVAERATGVTCLFFDGTFWSDSELAELEQSARTAREMAHLPVGGAGGSLELLSTLAVKRRYYTHVNNTNPILREGSPERRAVEARGWAVAEDGLEVVL